MQSEQTTAPSIKSPFLTISQLADLLQFDRRTIERWASAGRIPGRIQLSARAVRYKRDLILTWIEDGCPAPNEN